MNPMPFPNLTDDEQTEIIGMYLEDVRMDAGLWKQQRGQWRKNPCSLSKVDGLQEGARATASHTASMAVEDTLFEGAMRQAGVLRMKGIDDFLRTLKGFLNMPLPQGERLALLLTAGHRPS